MTTVQSNTALTTPSLLALTTRIRRAVTKETLSSLTDDPVNNTIVDAINDSVADIYYRNRWNWAKTLGNIQLQSATSEYPLPANFFRMATEPAVYNATLIEVSPEEWERNTYTPSWNSNAAIAGQPNIYMLDRALIKFWPTPSDSFIAAYPTIPIIYYRKPPARLVLATDSANSPDVPPEFIEILSAYGVFRLKLFLHYDDAPVEMDRYEKLLLNRIQTDLISVHPSRLRPRNFRSANFG